MATPASRILVVYIEEAAAERQRNARALDEVARRGCSGALILPEDGGALHAILGVDGDALKSDGSFPYPKMPVAFFSDSEAACSTAKAVGMPDVELVSTAKPHEPVAARVQQLLRVEDPKSKQLVFFHMAKYQSDHWIFQLLDTLLGSEATPATPSDCFVSIVQAAQKPHTVDPAVTVHPLRPRQSYERHHGKYPDSAESSPRRLLFSSFHSDRTRRDLATTFTERDIDSLGAYGTMDARIFMKEMAFRLGFAPKYGA